MYKYNIEASYLIFPQFSQLDILKHHHKLMLIHVLNIEISSLSNYVLTQFRGLKSPGSITGKFCVGVKSPLQNLITNYELRITNYFN
jgi:hypothetical protein